MFLIFSNAFAGISDTVSFVQRKRTCFREGESYLSFGTGVYGLSNAVSRNHALLADFKSTGLPPVFARYEYAVNDYLGLGGTFFFHAASYKWNKTVEVYNNETWSYEPIVYAEKYSGLSLGFMGRANIHFATTKTSDPYFGIGAGYEFFMMKMTSDDPLVSDRIPNRPLPFSVEAMIGWRTYVGDNTALYFEAGYGKMLFNMGITMWLQ
ncbi:MAG: hypothetical protein CVU11_06040 [Bacteroidetes bacterium HGW-Bacteroidetes-6]|nr:MAG: hypothetical protein CVU11_06040 [Bacteroidetes bacterium HGW-Bacteroidetes-6]